MALFIFSDNRYERGDLIPQGGMVYRVQECKPNPPGHHSSGGWRLQLVRADPDEEAAFLVMES